jgi:aconitate hydratase
MSSSIRRPLPGVAGVEFLSLPAAEKAGLGPVRRLPYSIRVLVENLLRHAAAEDVRALVTGDHDGRAFPFRPGRLLLQDSAGLPVLADLLDLADTIAARGGDPAAASPRLRMDLVVDHAVEVDHWGSPDAAARNLDRELTRHADRYGFLRHAQRVLPNLRIVPPGIGICHQLNLEVLAEVVHVDRAPGRAPLAGFDTLLGTDSHTTMVNALSVLGWGVGGIEATAALLGEPVFRTAPRVVGVRLTGRPRPGVLATDLALALTALLRQHDVVGRVVEFCGPGVAALALPDRATLANMAPEYGATMGFFPADTRTLDYLRDTGRSDAHVGLVTAYLRAQGMLWDAGTPEPEFDAVIEFDLSAAHPTVAGPSRPDQSLRLDEVPASARLDEHHHLNGGSFEPGAVVIAAITSCTNTSNPRALVTAGLLARNAVDRGLRVPWFTKTSFAPGSRVASRMLAATGLQAALDELGFHLVGHGCTTCMGNSGPLEPKVEQLIAAGQVPAAAVLSGNRNFPGRIHPSARLAYLASPPLVVAFALAGTVTRDLGVEPLGVDRDGIPVYLAELWPSDTEIDRATASAGLRELATANLAEIDRQLERWSRSGAAEPHTWGDEAAVIRRPPFLQSRYARPLHERDLHGARPLVVLGDAITTDEISPVSRILPGSAAGRWLSAHGVAARDMASFSARRLNHEVMLRGGFANPRIDNLMVPHQDGGVTRLMPDDVVTPTHEAAAEYERRQVPVVVVAGRDYGRGSARDWAAKVTRMLGVRAVLARGFERIHRTNLVAMGILPVRVTDDLAAELDGSETLDLTGMRTGLVPGGQITVTVHRNGRPVLETVATAHIETWAEVEWLRAGGVLPKALTAASNQVNGREERDHDRPHQRGCGPRG